MRAKCENGRLALEAKTWYPLDTTKQLGKETEIHECFNDECCVLYNVSTRVRCNEERGYYGPLCGACDRKQGAMRSGGGCVICWEAWQNYIATTGITAAWVGVIGYYTIFEDFDAPEGDYASSALKLLMSHLQMLGVLGIFKAKGTAVFNDVMSRPSEVFGGSITSVTFVKCALDSQAYGTFIANMLLPCCVPLVASLWLIPLVLISRARMQKRNTEPIPIFKGRFGIPRALTKWKVLRVPMTAKERAQWREPVDFLSRLVAIQVFMLFTLYPSLISSVASILNCSDEIGGKRYLFADLSVTCFEGWHNVYASAAIFFGIVYCIGIPVLVYCVVAWKSPIACRKIVQVVNVPHLPADGEVEAEAGEEQDLANTDEEAFQRGDAVPVAPRQQRRRSVVDLVTTWKPRARCKRRTNREYASRAVRVRYGFLYNGYETDRDTDTSGIVVGWESTVMVRKLFVTLAGATISDAYLQILAALMILITALGLQAYFQPYEPNLLDVLDTLGLFALLCTQILSILYLYSDTAERPVLSKQTLEILVTVGLFLLNSVAIVIFGAVYVGYYFNVDLRCVRCRKLKRMRLVTDEAVIAQQLVERFIADEDDRPKMFWRNPFTDMAQRHAPRQFVTAGDPKPAWEWILKDEGVAFTTDSPQLVVALDEGEVGEPGQQICTLNLKTLALTPLVQVPEDVGGALCCGDSNKEATMDHGPRVAGANGLGSEMQAIEDIDDMEEDGGEGIDSIPAAGRFQTANPLVTRNGIALDVADDAPVQSILQGVELGSVEAEQVALKALRKKQKGDFFRRKAKGKEVASSQGSEKGSGGGEFQQSNAQ